MFAEISTFNVQRSTFNVRAILYSVSLMYSFQKALLQTTKLLFFVNRKSTDISWFGMINWRLPTLKMKLADKMKDNAFSFLLRWDAISPHSHLFLADSMSVLVVVFILSLLLFSNMGDRKYLYTRIPEIGSEFGVGGSWILKMGSEHLPKCRFKFFRVSSDLSTFKGSTSSSE